MQWKGLCFFHRVLEANKIKFKEQGNHCAIDGMVVYEDLRFFQQSQDVSIQS
jgi:hypothetical protein